MRFAFGFFCLLEATVDLGLAVLCLLVVMTFGFCVTAGLSAAAVPLAAVVSLRFFGTGRERAAMLGWRLSFAVWRLPARLGRIVVERVGPGRLRRVLELRQILAGEPLEAGEVLAAERGLHRELLRQRIDRMPAAVELVMQMRAGRHAGRADEADHLALAHRRRPA